MEQSAVVVNQNFLKNTPGSGYGYGDGDGDGYGYGYGYGSGYGYGDGDGDGYGYGYGSGYGYSYGELVESLCNAIAKTEPRGKKLAKQKVVFALWRSNADGSPSNGGGGGARKVGDVEEIAGDKPVLCGRGALHATHHPNKWQGDRLWLVALHQPVVRDDSKLGSLKREIIKELPNWWKK